MKTWTSNHISRSNSCNNVRKSDAPVSSKIQFANQTLKVPSDQRLQVSQMILNWKPGNDDAQSNNQNFNRIHELQERLRQERGRFAAVELQPFENKASNNLISQQPISRSGSALMATRRLRQKDDTIHNRTKVPVQSLKEDCQSLEIGLATTTKKQHNVCSSEELNFRAVYQQSGKVDNVANRRPGSAEFAFEPQNVPIVYQRQVSQNCGQNISGFRKSETQPEYIDQTTHIKQFSGTRSRSSSAPKNIAPRLPDQHYNRNLEPNQTIAESQLGQKVSILQKSQAIQPKIQYSSDWQPNIANAAQYTQSSKPAVRFQQGQERARSNYSNQSIKNQKQKAEKRENQVQNQEKLKSQLVQIMQTKLNPAKSKAQVISIGKSLYESETYSMQEEQDSYQKQINNLIVDQDSNVEPVIEQNQAATADQNDKVSQFQQLLLEKSVTNQKDNLNQLKQKIFCDQGIRTKQQILMQNVAGQPQLLNERPIGEENQLQKNHFIRQQMHEQVQKWTDTEKMNEVSYSNAPMMPQKYSTQDVKSDNTEQQSLAKPQVSPYQQLEQLMQQQQQLSTQYAKQKSSPEQTSSIKELLSGLRHQSLSTADSPADFRAKFDFTKPAVVPPRAPPVAANINMELFAIPQQTSGVHNLLISGESVSPPKNTKAGVPNYSDVSSEFGSQQYNSAIRTYKSGVEFLKQIQKQYRDDISKVSAGIEVLQDQGKETNNLNRKPERNVEQQEDQWRQKSVEKDVDAALEANQFGFEQQERRQKVLDIQQQVVNETKAKQKDGDARVLSIFKTLVSDPSNAGSPERELMVKALRLAKKTND